MIWGSLLYGMNICVWARLISKSSASKSTYGVYSPQSIRCDFCPLFSKSPRPDLSPFFSIKIVFSSQFTIHQEWVWFIASKINCIWLLSPESFEPARFFLTTFCSLVKKHDMKWHAGTIELFRIVWPKTVVLFLRLCVQAIRPAPLCLRLLTIDLYLF